MIKRFGDWDKARSMLTQNMASRLVDAIRSATQKNVNLLKRELVRGIKSQKPGGKPFIKLAESTAVRKDSNLALIDSGYLIGAISVKLLNDGGFVGFLKGDHPSGPSLASLAGILENGATIQQPNGAVIIIPPRPFLNPTLEQYRDQILKNYKDAIRQIIG